MPRPRRSPPATTLLQGPGSEFHEVVDRRPTACLQSAPLELRMRVLEVERVDLRRAALADRGGKLPEQDTRHQVLLVHGEAGLRRQPEHPPVEHPRIGQGGKGPPSIKLSSPRSPVVQGRCVYRCKSASTGDGVIDAWKMTQYRGRWSARGRPLQSGANRRNLGGASGSVNRLLRPDSVRHMSVTTAMQRPTVAHHDTQCDSTKTAREPGYAQARGRFRRWWQVLGSNQRRRSRRFYRPLPLAARATCLAPPVWTAQ